MKITGCNWCWYSRSHRFHDLSNILELDCVFIFLELETNACSTVVVECRTCFWWAPWCLLLLHSCARHLLPVRNRRVELVLKVYSTQNTMNSRNPRSYGDTNFIAYKKNFTLTFPPHTHTHYYPALTKRVDRCIVQPTHTYWCKIPTNDSYQQGPLLGVFLPTRAVGCN